MPEYEYQCKDCQHRIIATSSMMDVLPEITIPCNKKAGERCTLPRLFQPVGLGPVSGAGMSPSRQT